MRTPPSCDDTLASKAVAPRGSSREASPLLLVQPSSQLDVIDDFRFELLGRVTRASRAAQADGRLDPWLPLPVAEDHSRL